MGAEGLTAVFGVILGVALFAGLFAYHAIFLIPVPCTSGSCGPPSPDLQAYSATLHILAWVAFGVIDAAVAVAVTAAFIVGASRGAVSEGVRHGLFIYASAFTLAWIVFSTFLMSLALSTVFRFG
jgi:hypothetical protein